MSIYHAIFIHSENGSATFDIVAIKFMSAEMQEYSKALWVAKAKCK